MIRQLERKKQKMKNKLYGVFRFCFQSSRKGNQDAYKSELAYHLFKSFMTDGDDIHPTSSLKSMSSVGSKENALCSAHGCRNDDRHSRRHEHAIYSTYIHKFVVHECDEQGVWIPTKGELLDALHKVEETMPHVLQDVKLKPSFAEFLRKQIDSPKTENVLALEI